MAWNGSEAVPFVCKFARDAANTQRSTYFADVEAHEIAQLYAEAFNAVLPAKYPRISYVPVCILELVDRPGRPVCGAEQELIGRFRKYNNNVGAVCAQPPATTREALAEEAAEARARAASGLPVLENWDPVATAGAFSHFSFAHSGSSVLICDIQGVANLFTDPQIHTLNGRGFGLGNLGQTGIRAFMRRHQCTELCRAAGLQPIAAKDLNEKAVPPSFGPPGTGASSTGSSAAPPGGGAGSQASSSQQTPQRSMFSSASSANLGNQSSRRGGGSGGLQLSQVHTLAASAASAVSSTAAGASTVALSASRSSLLNEQQQQQYSSNASSPAQSPAASPRGAQATQGLGGGRGAGAASASRNHASAAAPAPAAIATPRSVAAKPVALDDSDEALMASIMGD